MQASSFARLAGFACVVVVITAHAGTNGGKDEAIFRHGFDAFHHPGILHDGARLAEVRAHLAQGDEPWSRAYTKMRNSGVARLDYTPQAVAHLTRKDNHSEKLRQDAMAAYTHALLHALTGDARHGATAVRILNLWANTLTSVDRATSQLDAAWAAEVLPRAAELIRYGYTPAPGEPALDVAKVTELFLDVLLPELDPASPGATSSAGNWELAMADGAINIGIFTDETAVFERGLAMWRARVPAYIYLTRDGAQPVPPPGGRYNTPGKLKCFWNGAPSATESCPLKQNFTYLHGMAQETCRDFSHVVMGLSSIIYAAQSAAIQGIDLLGEEEERILEGFEFTARSALAALDAPGNPRDPANDEGKVDPSICGGWLKYGGTAYTLGFEYGYAELAGRRGHAMPSTRAMLERIRPTGAALHMIRETVTGPIERQ